MKPPRTITIGPFDYEITTGRDARIQLSDDGDGGGCHPDLLSIVVNDDAAPGIQRETVFHESIHGLMHLVGLNDELGEKVEEKVVRRLSPVLLDLLRRNPKLVAFLVAP